MVPRSGEDAILFAMFALLITVAFASRLSALWVLLAGAACEVVNYWLNLGRLSNAMALWLGMQV